MWELIVFYVLWALHGLAILLLSHWPMEESTAGTDDCGWIFYLQ